MKQKFKRKYLVDRTYQFSQAGAVILGNSLVIALIAFILSWYFLIASDGSMVVNTNRQVPLYLCGCLAVVVLLTALFSLRRSRSTAGMMTILHKILTDAGQGKFPDRPLAFRNSDYSGFRNLAGPLNTCLSQMKNTRERDIRAAVERLENLSDATDQDPEIQQDLEEIIQMLEQTPSL